jgi:cell division initiation protein
MKQLEVNNMEPTDVQDQKFKVKFRGYDTQEVDAYLEKVSKELNMRVREVNQLQGQLDDLRSDIEKRELDIEARREQANKEIAIVEEQCATMIKDARITADKILKDARIELTNLKSEIETTKNLKNQLEQYFESFLEFNTRLIKLWKKEVEKREEFK